MGRIRDIRFAQWNACTGLADLSYTPGQDTRTSRIIHSSSQKSSYVPAGRTYSSHFSTLQPVRDPKQTYIVGQQGRQGEDATCGTRIKSIQTHHMRRERSLVVRREYGFFRGFHHCQMTSESRGAYSRMYIHNEWWNTETDWRAPSQKVFLAET